MPNTFCSFPTRDYEATASGQSDAEIETQLLSYYPTLDEEQRKRAAFRKWRRCLIVEALKRGIITKDPGLGPPERS